MTAPTITPGQTKIGWIGTGVMGSSMLGHLIDAGFEAMCYTRSKAKAEVTFSRRMSSKLTASTSEKR